MGGACQCRHTVVASLLVAIFLAVIGGFSAFAQEPLPSWNDTAAKSRIMDFVKATVTYPSSTVCRKSSLSTTGPASLPASTNSSGASRIFAAGNCDGDYEMLRWVTATKPGFAMIIHHTDGQREYAYDRQSAFGKLDKALDEAENRNWLVVDMKADWKKIFAFEQ
ncbi:hypothetical protein EV561_107233 [Rhizobium sp. BK376]|nr:hypothetical protein EV561_107233 [Rhizobium sp. BK376]